MLSIGLQRGVVNIALPTMAADLGVDVPSISWVVTGFLVTQATLLALAGRAGDLYGRRRIFVAGVLVLCVASVLCAVAPTAPAWWRSGSSRPSAPVRWPAPPPPTPTPPSCSGPASAAWRWG